MQTSRKIYEKDKEIVYVHDKFIYCSEIYKIWNGGFSLIEEKHYSSNKPIVLKSKNLKILKYKEYTLRRFFDLKFAPEEYLISNGFKIREDEEYNC